MTGRELERLRLDLLRRFNVAREAPPTSAGIDATDVSPDLVRCIDDICRTVHQFAAERNLLEDEDLSELANLIAWSSRALPPATRSGPIFAALMAVRDAAV